MEFFKQKNHRNTKYMQWLKRQKCVVTRKKAQVAHHIRLGTNGGQGLKPSDYFCIPLLNIYHTGGKHAVHNIGEETFFKKFNLSKEKIFSYYLSLYLTQLYKITYDRQEEESDTEFIDQLIRLIENNRSEEDIKKDEVKKVKLPSITKNEFYQRAKEAKKVKDKELRKQLKEDFDKPILINTPKVSESEFYQKAKEAKRAKDKELREQLKRDTKPEKITLPKASKSEFYQKAKKAQKIKDNEIREQRKNTPRLRKTKSPKASDSEFYQLAKEAKKEKDKEIREQLKIKRKKCLKKTSTLTKENPAYQKAKEARKEYEKQIREENKAKQSEYRKAQYRRLKELKK